MEVGDELACGQAKSFCVVDVNLMDIVVLVDGGAVGLGVEIVPCWLHVHCYYDFLCIFSLHI